MNLWRAPALLRHAHLPCLRIQPRLRPRPGVAARRAYAARRDRDPVTTSSLLSQALDQKQRGTRRDDQVGPFQLGLTPPTAQDAANTKKWSELSAGGKVARTTARTTNLAVILVGAGFSALLFYALTSEMFSTNSATVLYGQACDKIKASPKLGQHLAAPLVFHHNPPSALRPRHRNHQISSQIVVDARGREHMLLHFFVQGRPPGAPGEEPASLPARALRWTAAAATHLSEMSTEELADGICAQAEGALEGAKRVFRFLSGDVGPSPRQPPPPAREQAEEKKEDGWTAGLTGLFSGLRGPSTGGTSGGHAASSDSGIYTDGEVHADLVMNDKGRFEFRYLLVDIPSSSQRSSRRVFIERANGVRENEPVVQWHA